MARRIFKDFSEFFSLTRPMSSLQRAILIDSLPTSERKRIVSAMEEEGWGDLFVRNELDGLVKSIKDELGEDLILLRIQVMSGKSKKVKKEFWKYVSEVFSKYSNKDTFYIFGNIKALESDDDHFLLINENLI